MILSLLVKKGYTPVTDIVLVLLGTILQNVAISLDTDLRNH